MTFKEEGRYFKALYEMEYRIPFKELEYRNMVVATAIAKGNGEKLTEDWLRKTLLGDVEDGFITYMQALKIKDDYMQAINEVKEIVG